MTFVAAYKTSTCQSYLRDLLFIFSEAFLDLAFNTIAGQAPGDSGDKNSDEEPHGRAGWKFMALTFQNDERIIEKATEVFHKMIESIGDNNILFLYDVGWMSEENDELFHKLSEQYVEDLGSYAKSIGKSNPFLYLDNADPTQDPLSTYGHANIQKMRAAAVKYDPEGVFQTMVPGEFKLSKVRVPEDEEQHDEL
ncbi:hypothetical protein IWX90DRAFT_516452 [Phyllosticta citrichinensis]|uniref:Berberine/berberine-like domain-containing protein n=1 Tax=Phyllosticta citrichinensis TaxID=1130410 RepID=A0ABR1XJ60_9PEZI